MKCDRCGVENDALAGHAGAMLCARCAPSFHGLAEFKKVRLLGMSVEVADGHIAIMLEGSSSILMSREDWIELRNFMEVIGGYEFYRDHDVPVGTVVEASVSIAEI